MSTAERDESRFDPCVLTPACIHRHGHGGPCEPRTEIVIGPADLYACAIRAGLDLVQELVTRPTS